MNRAAHRFGFGLSSLVHLGLALAVLWTWQQRPDAIALPGETVPVTLSMFAEPLPVAAPLEQPVALPEPPLEPVAEPEPEPVAKPKTEPLHKVEAKPVEPTPEPVAGPARTSPKPKPKTEPPPEAVAPPVARPVPPPPSASAAAARAAHQVALRARYKAALLAAIERHKFYPKRARRRGIEGEVRLSFTIEADGRLTDIRITDGSGSRLLDEAALSALRRLTRVDPLPAALGMSRWALTVPMMFDIH